MSFASAINLAKESGQKKLYLLIPQIGMGCFAKKFDDLNIGDKKVLFLFYLSAISRAMMQSDFGNFEEVSFCFSNYGGESYVADYYKTFESFYKEKCEKKHLKIKINFNFLFERESFFNIDFFSLSNRDPNTYFCILHAGDQKSFCNNGGFLDKSLEQVLAGKDNNNFLGVPWLLNVFWPIMIQGMIKEENKVEEEIAKMEEEEPFIFIYFILNGTEKAPFNTGENAPLVNYLFEKRYQKDRQKWQEKIHKLEEEKRKLTENLGNIQKEKEKLEKESTTWKGRMLWTNGFFGVFFIYLLWTNYGHSFSKYLNSILSFSQK